MPMIGASPEDLENASFNFNVNIERAITTGTKVLFRTRGAVNAIKAETTKARFNCVTSITGMKQGVFEAKNLLDGAEYVGKNADVARLASGDMDQRAAQTVQEITAAFDEFEQKITALGEEMADIALSFDNYSKGAADDQEQMAVALKRQKEDLASAMEGMTWA